MTEQDKMNQGLWYDAMSDTELKQLRMDAKDLCFKFNQVLPSDSAAQEKILATLVQHRGEGVTIRAPFYVDYGFNCYIGDHTYLNRNVYLMDGGRITIGRHCFIGPSVGIYTAEHPLRVDERNLGLERSLPVTIGDNVWIGAGAILLPGVTVGDNSVIGAGSVVTRDIPAGVVAAGNPCRVLRPITEADSISDK